METEFLQQASFLRISAHNDTLVHIYPNRGNLKTRYTGLNPSFGTLRDDTTAAVSHLCDC